MFSTNTVVPCACSSAAISMAWQSVGNPGYGAVRTGGTARSGPIRVSCMYPSPQRTPQPAWSNTVVTAARCRCSAFRSVTSPPAAAAAHR